MQWEVDKAKSLLEEIETRISGTRRELKRLLECNQACVNGKIVHHHGHILEPGDKIHWQEGPITLPAQKFIFNQAHILFENDELLAYDKPAGLTSYEIEEGIRGARLVHRLDRMTSGVLLLAKSGLRKWTDLFRRREVKKTYRALVDGYPDQDSGRFHTYIRKVRERFWDECGPNRGEEAITDWKLLGTGERCSLLELYPKTGRTHQLRVQLNRAGHPVLGDGHYCRSYYCKYRPARHLLHATTLEFADLKIRSRVGRDFAEALRAVACVR